jgi:DNA (cytosine-5)-methyltransferase 1
MLRKKMTLLRRKAMKSSNEARMAKIEAIDLFCGVGGLTSGLITSGVTVVAGIDVDKSCRYPFEANHPKARFFEQDVTTLTGAQLNAMWSPGTTRLLAGCAPCQPFSSYTLGKGASHAKWGMLEQFARLVKESQPDLVTMENVPGLQRQAPFQQFLKTLKKCGFHVTYGVLNAADYGVPQQRRRLVLLASIHGPVTLPAPTHQGKEHWTTVRAAISHLPKLQHGRTSADDAIHRASSLSPLNLKRVRASKPGGTWRDWPTELVATCHTKESGKNSTGVYGRMVWDAPAPTMTTQCNGFGNGRFGHPEQNRAISLREAAIFQSFPHDYIFAEKDKPVAAKTVARLIGNAVPPKLAEAVGRQLIAAMR